MDTYIGMGMINRNFGIEVMLGERVERMGLGRVEILATALSSISYHSLSFL